MLERLRQVFQLGPERWRRGGYRRDSSGLLSVPDAQGTACLWVSVVDLAILIGLAGREAATADDLAMIDDARTHENNVVGPPPQSIVRLWSETAPLDAG